MFRSTYLLCLSLIFYIVGAQNTLNLSASDAHIQYSGPGWQHIIDPSSCSSDQNVSLTHNKGDSLSLQFVGVSEIEAFGPFTSTGATFSVLFDSNITSNGDISQLATSRGTSNCGALFKISNINSSTSHVLTVTHTGVGSGVIGSGVLTVDQFLFIQDADSSNSSSTTSSIATPFSVVPVTSTAAAPGTPTSATPNGSDTSNNTHSATSSSTSKAPIIAGAVVGTIVFSFVILILALFLRGRLRIHRRGLAPSKRQWNENFFDKQKLSSKLDAPITLEAAAIGVGQNYNRSVLRQPGLEQYTVSPFLLSPRAPRPNVQMHEENQLTPSLTTSATVPTHTSLHEEDQLTPIVSPLAKVPMSAETHTPSIESMKFAPRIQSLRIKTVPPSPSASSIGAYSAMTARIEQFSMAQAQVIDKTAGRFSSSLGL